MPFTPAPNAPPDFLRRLVDDAKAGAVLAPWNCKLSHRT
jgi:hypothetical protein